MTYGRVSIINACIDNCYDSTFPSDAGGVSLVNTGKMMDGVVASRSRVTKRLGNLDGRQFILPCRPCARDRRKCLERVDVVHIGFNTDTRECIRSEGLQDFSALFCRKNGSYTVKIVALSKLGSHHSKRRH